MSDPEDPTWPPIVDRRSPAPIAEGMMLTPAGLVQCLEETVNGETDLPLKSAERLLKDTFVDASMLLTYEPPPREWVVRHRIPKGEITLFSGPGGLGKSTIVMQLQCAMAGKQPWLGYEVTPGRSLALYCEENMDEAARRMKAIRRRLDVSWEDMTQVSYHSLKGCDMYLCDVDKFTSWVEPNELVTAIQAEVERLKVTLLILDSLNRLYSGNENSRMETTGFLRILERMAMETNVAILLLSHPSKSGQTDGSGYSGSTSWDSMVRSRIYLEYQKIDPVVARPGDLDDPLLVLKWPKGNYAGRGKDLELERSLDPQEPLENPPIYEPVAEATQDGETLFLDVIDAVHKEGLLPRPNNTGRSKHLYAPTLVYQHAMNRRRGSKRPLTMEQCSNIYTKLMQRGRLELIEVEDDRKRKTWVVRTAMAGEVPF